MQAITVGRAPRSGRGFRIRRALAATRLPRPVSFGLGTPSARPARAAVAGSRMLRLTGTKLGDHITISTELGQRRIHIVGEAFSRVGEASIIMDAGGLTGLVERTAPSRFEVALTGGTDPHAYVQALSAAVGSQAVLPQVTADSEGNDTIAIMLGLISTLSLLLAGVAALGVFNTVVLNTRERVHEIGVLKSIGLVGGALAVPFGVALHRWILPVMASAAGTGIPDSVVAVYSRSGCCPYGRVQEPARGACDGVDRTSARIARSGQVASDWSNACAAVAGREVQRCRRERDHDDAGAAPGGSAGW